MNKKYSSRYRQEERSSSGIVIALVVVMVVLVGIALGIRVLLAEPGEQQYIDPVVETTEETTEPDPGVHVVSEAVISVTGDILMHMPVINTGLTSDGSYNFNVIFQYLQPFSSRADLAIANLETTLCGTDAGYKYSGYPAFNCPDEIVDALKNAGFDMLLTANNHCYDTSEYGFLRTVKTIRSKGLECLGTRAEAADPKYFVRDLNGIKVGLVCYTYEAPPEKPVDGTVYMNMNAMSPTAGALVNSFLPGQLDSFYYQARECLENMKRDGAEASVIFMHWGQEYQTVPDAEQQAIAQQLCDLGYDVIVGGHPHVIQPVDLLTSRLEPAHKTVCLYSTGNAVSNQRISEMNLKTGHTEDGLLFSIRFTKYSDDTVYLDSVELLPCWVDLRQGIAKQYRIIPLDKENMSSWQELYSLSADGLANAQKSYDRTFALTGTGMELTQRWLTEQREQREADYLADIPETLAVS